MRPTRRRLLAAVGAALVAPWARAEPQLVIVAAAHSPIRSLTAVEIRRLYLGAPVTVDGREVEPLRNVIDPMVQEVFLQRVLFMSLHAYERQAAARVFRTGGNPLRRFTDLPSLLAALAANPLSVTYMPVEQAARLPELKIITPL